MKKLGFLPLIVGLLFISTLGLILSLNSSILVSVNAQQELTVTIISPQSITYPTNDVTLFVTVNIDVPDVDYNLDNGGWIPLHGQPPYSQDFRDLAEGSHSVTVRAYDYDIFLYDDSTVLFSVDTHPPEVTISSPAAGIYTSSTLPELVHSAVDNLDSTPSLVDVEGWSTDEGTHTVVVRYADDAENVGSASRTYTVDDTPPSITISSPTSSVYSTSDILLTFSVSEEADWIGYSLDGANNITITGDSLLSLSDGSHSVVVYANDTAGNMGVSDVVDFSVDVAPPLITVSSPISSVYSTRDVPLTFSVNEETSWIGYSLDGQNNITISGNTSINALSDGLHNLVVYANDTFGKMGVSGTIYFNVQIPVDTIPPTITITSPQETTYSTSNVFLEFTINDEVSWVGYSLDNKDNVTIIGNSLLSGLSGGSHTIVVYATDTGGNTGASDVVQFSVSIPSVDTTPPSIKINSPSENSIYSMLSVDLNFNINEQVSWMAYSLDGGNNITISGNATISSLSAGSHTIVAYATDTAGNTGVSDTIQFTISIDTISPTITIISPQEISYSTSEVSLDFTINEPVTWTAYSLDGEENVTITGPLIISGLSVGSHDITLFAKDAAGNTGSSDLVQFNISATTIDTTPPTVLINSPSNTTYETNQISFSFQVNEEPTLKFYSLDGKANTTIIDPIVLNDLSDGEHQLIMYAKDIAGNMGVSKVIVFTITPKNNNFSQIWVAGVILIIAGAGFIFAVYISYNLVKSRRTEI
jgi:hypothetical protein